jgi:hypothetical protein
MRFVFTNSVLPLVFVCACSAGGVSPSKGRGSEPGSETRSPLVTPPNGGPACSAMTTGFNPDKPTCRTREQWRAYVEADCDEQGLGVTKFDVATPEPCGEGESATASSECCDGTPGAGWSPLCFGFATLTDPTQKRCLSESEWLADAKALCARSGLKLTSFNATSRCADGGYSSMNATCCL